MEYITIEKWKHIPAGETVPTGFANPATITAPSEQGVYTLYEGVYPDNTHAGWKWVKEE